MTTEPEPQSRWSLSYTGNRVMWAVASLVIIWALTSNLIACVLVGLVVYIALTVTARRR